MTRRWFIGLSTGTSATGVGAALVRVEGAGTDLALRLEHFAHLPYGRDLGSLLARVGAEPVHAPRQLGVLHRVLGESFTAACRQVVEQARASWQQILAVAVPGQEVWHDPDGRYPSTLDLGMAAVVAERTGLTVVSDFRSRDLVVGGQGRPVTALGDAILLRAPQEHRVAVHLGGTVSVVSLPPGKGLRDVVAFQAAPGTLLLDGLMRLLTGGRETFDPGGRHAVQGRCIDVLLDRWLQHPFLRRRVPRAVPVHEFGNDFLTHAVQEAKAQGHSLHDVLCTATHFIARATVRAVAQHVPGTPARVVVSGGGARNGFLWRLLDQLWSPLPLERTDAVGVPSDARKGLAYAALAALAADGVAANLPAATGASGPRLLGTFTPGSDANWARCLAWMAGQTAHQRLAA